jgi:hypothetical protein
MGIPVAGTAYLFVDGSRWPLRGNFRVSPSTIERTAVVGQDGVHGYQELPVAAYFEGDMTTDPAIDWIGTESIVNSTIMCQLVNGWTFVLRNAWSAGRRELNTREGSVAVRFEGMAVQGFAGASIGVGVAGP